MLHLVIALAFTLGTPHMFAPGIVSGSANDGSPTFSPDGNTLFFTRSNTSAVILESQRVNGRWSKPAIASFSGKLNDWAPELSPDGRYLVFVEVRPKVGAFIYRVERTGSGWSAPERLP